MRRVSVLLAAVVSVSAIACGGDDGRGDEVSLDGPTGPTDLPPLAAVGPCVEAEVKGCKVVLPAHGNVQENCFVGVQICADGEWSACVGEEELGAQLSQDPDAESENAD